MVDAHQSAAIASKKIELIVQRQQLIYRNQVHWQDSLCRLFWVIYVYEGDLVAELRGESGLTRLEDIVPYPTSTSAPTSPVHDPNATALAGEHMFHYFSRTTVPSLDVGAFQISTNSAIRRFLNRVSAVMVCQIYTSNNLQANLESYIKSCHKIMW